MERGFSKERTHPGAYHPGAAPSEARGGRGSSPAQPIPQPTSWTGRTQGHGSSAGGFLEERARQGLAAGEELDKGEERRAPQVGDWPAVCREAGMDLRGGRNRGGSPGSGWPGGHDGKGVEWWLGPNQTSEAQAGMKNRAVGRGLRGSPEVGGAVPDPVAIGWSVFQYIERSRV